MNFDKFVETLQEELKKVLPEELHNAQMEVRQTNKLNDTYLGMTVLKEGSTVAPTINLNEFYEAYDQMDISMNEIVERAASIIQMDSPTVDVEKIKNYDQAKEALFVRISSIENNQSVMENVPHSIIEDMVMTYHIALSENNIDRASVIISQDMLNTYGITKEQLHTDALANCEVLYPAKIESMDSVMRKIMERDAEAMGIDPSELDFMFEETPKNPMLVVTNESTSHGAAVMFYPGTLDDIGEKLNGNFFILPSSVHETLVLPDDGEMSAQELKAMVTEVNATQVDPKDRLTNEVYHYDTKDRVFEKASSFESRQKQKEQLAEKAKADHVAEQPTATKPKAKKHDMSL